MRQTNPSQKLERYHSALNWSELHSTQLSMQLTRAWVCTQEPDSRYRQSVCARTVWMHTIIRTPILDESIDHRDRSTGAKSNSVLLNVPQFL